MIDPTAPTRPVPLAAVSPARDPGLVGRLARLWQHHAYGMPDGFPFEAVILDYRDGVVHVRNEAGKDFWTSVLTLGCIEVIDGPGEGASPPVEFKGPGPG